MSNIEEIIKTILNFHPQTLEHTNKEGMNILHMAILYRHIDIFYMMIKSEVLARRLLSATDNEGNSILHMVSQKRKIQASEKMQSPALQLQDELLFFKVHFYSPISHKCIHCSHAFTWVKPFDCSSSLPKRVSY